MAKPEKRFRPDQRPKKVRPTPVKRGLTAAEELAAASFEASLNTPRVVNAPAAPIGIASRTASTQRLAAEVSAELPVVRRDLRRILVTYGALLGLLAAIWIVATLTGFISA
jgi:hypothetical protein